jgi:hypothetical protein
MAIHVLISDLAKKDCQTHGMGADCLRTLADRIEGSQNLELFERNNPHPVLVKKKFYGRDKRLVAIQKHVGPDTVIVLLRVLIRGNSEYEDNFEGRVPAETTLAYVENALQKAAPAPTLTTFVQERNATDPPTPLPGISGEEWNFLVSSAYLGADEDTIICETHEFVEDLHSSLVRAQHIRIPDLILRALSTDADKVSIVESVEARGLRIVAYHSPRTHQCVLLRVFFRADEEAETAKSEWSAKLQEADHLTILRFCRISYPSLICSDEPTWVQLHSDDEGVDGVANLSLSPEEGEILTSCDRYEGEKSGYPLFINGRAGSGKSTLLQYLFSFAFRRWLMTLGSKHINSTRPLYLASSGNLLRVAHDSARSILLMNSSQILEGYGLNDDEMKLLDSCFQQTGSFMYSLLTDEQAIDFPIQNRVDYARFRRLWNGHFRNEPKALRNYGPQVSWHVIRGLIKGFSSSELLEKDDYEGLPRDERAVSKETFERVYDKVWLNWYRPKCGTENLWDDQDLVRLLIEEDQLPRQHVAIFCDEAQDFTRVELDAIYQCSLFSKRSLDAQSVPRIPFVFAGDPFQTLNPTGFRWESVQAAFTERLVASLHRFSYFRELPDLHYEELTFNYRSAKRIVHFCNTLQASRALLFQHNTLRPQETWRIQDDQNAPAFLDIANIQIKQALKDQKDLVLIVPCEEGEESEYVSGDPFLKEIVDLGDDGVPLNVVSAARSKGLEFRRVGLYGWSKRAEAERIATLLRNPENAQVGADEKLELEYFMNNLYVAASRAQRRLFVIDAEESRNGLWWIVDDDEHLEKLKSSLLPEWASHIGSMVSGASDSFKYDQDTNKRRAEQQKAEGMAKLSSFTLRQAARYYELDGNDLEASRCRGYAHRYSRRYRESAEQFEKSGDLRDAVLSLWDGEEFLEIARLANRQPTEAGLPECVLSSFVTGQEASPHECAELLNRLLHAFGSTPEYHRRIAENSWKSGVEQALSKLFRNTNDELRGVAADRIVDPLTELIQLGLQVSHTTLARLLMKAENFDRVLELLAENSNAELYRDAIALKGIQASARGLPISTDDASAIGDYLLRTEPRQVAAAAEYFYKADNAAQLRHCFEQGTMGIELPIGDLEKLIILALKGWMRHQNWGDLVSTLETGRIAPDKSKSDGKRQGQEQVNQKVLDLIRQSQVHYRIIIPSFSISTELSGDTSQAKLDVQRYLKQCVGDKDWRAAVSPIVMGAAIERAGKDIDALEFYEKLIVQGSSAAEKQYARIRWTVCKLRQAERQGSRKNENEARNFMDRFAITEDELKQEFPAIDQADFNVAESLVRPAAKSGVPPEVLPDRERISVGILEMNYLAERGWVNIESEDGLRARVLLTDQSVESEDTDVVNHDDGSLECPEILLSVSWNENGDAILRHQGQVRIARRSSHS